MRLKPDLIELPYTATLQHDYKKLLHLPGFVLLESADKRLGRYDILSARPYGRVHTDHLALDNPLHLLRNELPYPVLTEATLPFQGGAIGFLSYDLGAYALALKPKVQESLARLPLMDFFLYDWALIADHRLKKLTLFAANTQSDTHKIIKEVLTLWSGPAPVLDPFSLSQSFSPLLARADYDRAHAAIKEALIQGRVYQVNLTQAFHAAFQGESYSLYEAARRANPQPYAAFLRMIDCDILSFSPERFLRHQDACLLTAPIKGTIARDSDLQRDEALKNHLAACPKNLAEHVMIVDLLRNDLGKIASPGTVSVDKFAQIQSFSALHHMVSEISAHIAPKTSPMDAFWSCFPGGSITGAPKIEAMKMICELEQYARCIYTGSIAYFSFHEAFDSNIAIRTILAKDGKLHLNAGGGIVLDSTSDAEYEECLLKIQAILSSADQSCDKPSSI